MRHRASIYVLTLSCAMLVTLIGVSAVLAVRSQQQAVAATTDFATARVLAQSAIELGMYMVDRMPDWRTDLSAGNWYEDQPLGDGTFTLHVDDPCDGDLSNAFCDPVILTGQGVQRDARYMIQVTLQSAAAHADPLPTLLADYNPVGYWRLGDHGVTTAADEVGTQDGRYQNGPVSGMAVPYRCDTATYFDGSNDFVEIPHVDDYLLDEGTIMLWFNADDTWYGRGLISKDSMHCDDGGHFYLRLEWGRIFGRLQSKNQSYEVNCWDYHYPNRWYHVAMTFGPDGLWLYVNGDAEDRDSYTGGLGTSSGGAGNHEPIAIGVNTNRSSDLSTDGWDEPYRGLIDEVVILPVQLDEDEIELIVDAGTTEPDWSMRIVPGSWKRIVD